MTQQVKRIKFGTDGWRGIIADDFTFANVEKVTQAVSDYFLKDSDPGQVSIVVGYDTRFLSKEFAQLVSRILAANGIKVFLSDTFVPTPVVSFTAKHLKLTAGVMVTASHNPPIFNGIKIKNSFGGAMDIEGTSAVEKLIDKNPLKILSFEEALSRGLIQGKDLTVSYKEFLGSYVDIEKIRNSSFKVLVDFMYGSASQILPSLLADSSIKLHLLHADKDPSFGERHPEPIFANLQELSERLRKEHYDIGLALDGDGDRIAGMLPGGEFLHPQKILPLLMLHLAKNRNWKGGVVKTVCGSQLIDRVAKDLGIEIYETPVGFKYISELMQTKSILTGGEEAGGIGFKNYIPERDGSLAGLLLLEMMAYENEGIQEILDKVEAQYGRFYYLRKDFRLEKMPLKSLDSVDFPEKLLDEQVEHKNDMDGIKLIAKDGSWLMFRLSGTESLVRIYAETDDLTKAEQLIELGTDLIKRASSS